jgi:hypothetical protein
MAGTAWSPGGIIASTANADNSYITQSITATVQGQTLFTLTNFLYAPATGSLFVFINGAKQRLTVDYTETSTATITLVTGVDLGDIVEIVGLVGTSGATNAAASATAAAASAAAALISQNAAFSYIALCAAQVTLATAQVALAVAQANAASASAAAALVSQNAAAASAASSASNVFQITNFLGS